MKSEPVLGPTHEFCGQIKGDGPQMTYHHTPTVYFLTLMTLDTVCFQSCLLNTCDIAAAPHLSDSHAPIPPPDAAITLSTACIQRIKSQVEGRGHYQVISGGLSARFAETARAFCLMTSAINLREPLKQGYRHEKLIIQEKNSQQ